MNKYAGNDQETPCHCCGGSGQVTSPLHDKTPNASPAHNPMDKVASSAHEPPAS